MAHATAPLRAVRPFFACLMAHHSAGGDWLGPLLAATPHGPAVLGDMIGSPGELLETLTQPGTNWLLRCFEYPVSAPRELLTWFIENPGELVWPRGATYSEATTTLRRALLDDVPPGRSEAQRQARELVATRPLNAREWWRFEGESMLDCVLMTDRLVVTIEGKRTEPISATTDWYPKRSQLVRNLEAAKQLAHGRQWCSVLMSEQPIPEGTDAGLADVLEASAPHLDPDEQRQLASRYLGNLTWQKACEAVGLPFSSLPTTHGRS